MPSDVASWDKDCSSGPFFGLFVGCQAVGAARLFDLARMAGRLYHTVDCVSFL